MGNTKREWGSEWGIYEEREKRERVCEREPATWKSTLPVKGQGCSKGGGDALPPQTNLLRTVAFTKVRQLNVYFMSYVDLH